MKILGIISLTVAALAAAVLVGSAVAQASYARRAQLIQRVERSAGADLFDDAGSPIGSPQLLVIDDAKAFTGGRTQEGAAIVDEGYLKEHGIYPLQMQTVSFVAGNVRLGAIVGLALGLGGYALSRRRARRQAVPA